MNNTVAMTLFTKAQLVPSWSRVKHRLDRKSSLTTSWFPDTVATNAHLAAIKPLCRYTDATNYSLMPI